MKQPLDRQEIERIEALLRAAADFDPVEPLPAGWAARALARRDGAVRCGWPWGRMALATGLAAAAVVLLFWMARAGIGGENRTPPQIVQSPPAPQQEAVTPPPAPERTPPKQEPVRPRILPALDRSRRSLPVRLVHHRRAPRHRAAPRARWQVETVRRYTTGLIAPAWLAQRDEEGGEVVFTPVMLNIPVQSGETIQPAGYSVEDK